MAKNDAAIYARVSTDDKGQDPRNQIAALREHAARAGVHVVAEYIERESASGRRTRPEFERMLADADRGRFGILLVWALDRLSREGTLKTLLLIDRLARCGVKVKSHQEPWLDPSSPMYDLLLPVFAWIANQESRRIGERVKAGLQRVRAEGVRIGRPRVEVDAGLVVEAYGRLRSIRKTARELELSASSVRRLLVGEGMRQKPGAKSWRGFPVGRS
jgi:DNA invertase Pin-like site-specific DNA recombinase